MKIAILAHALYPIAQPYAGGLEMITYLLCDRLHQLGHQVHLYAHPDSEVNCKLIPFEKSDRWTENYLYCMEQNSNSTIEEVNQYDFYQQALYSLKSGQYDVIHNHSLHSLSIIEGNTFTSPYITTFHTPIFPDLHYGVSELKSDFKQSFTVVSERSGQVWSEILKDQYKVILNGIDTQNWNFNLDPTPYQAIWYGRICKEKAPHHAILAAKKNNTKLCLAGPISNTEYYEQYIAPLIDWDQITHIGHLSHEELNRVIAQSSFTYFTSTWDEPYGLVLAESLACGTPVVGYRVGAAPEILTANTGILVEKGDIDALAEAALQAPFLSRTACRNRAVDFCDADQMVGQYLDLYESEIAKRKVTSSAACRKNILVGQPQNQTI